MLRRGQLQVSIPEVTQRYRRARPLLVLVSEPSTYLAACMEHPEDQKSTPSVYLAPASKAAGSCPDMQQRSSCTVGLEFSNLLKSPLQRGGSLVYLKNSIAKPLSLFQNLRSFNNSLEST